MKSDVNKIPILTFHALEEPTTPISFPPALFVRAIKKWYAAGWRTISLADALAHLRARTPAPPKTFVLTFDDGYASVYRYAFPLLNELGMTATIFVAPNENNSENATPLPTLYNREMLRWGEIREMNAGGIQFGAHTLTHRDLRTLRLPTVEHELRASQQALADALGAPIPFFAYPGGYYNADIRALTMQYYNAACSDHLGIATPDSDFWGLERVETFYLRAPWAADTFIESWLPLYVAARGIPRRLRRMIMK